MGNFDVGFMTHEYCKGMVTDIAIAHALVLLNNNLCQLVNEVKEINRHLDEGANVNVRIEGER